MKLQIRGSVEVHPTEDPRKIEKAVVNIFPLCQVQHVDEGIRKIWVFTSEELAALERFQFILRQDGIRDAVRKVLLTNIFGQRLKFWLNKQVAFVGHISICEALGESPLGPIQVELECEDMQKLVDWLAPKSQKTSH